MHVPGTHTPAHERMPVAMRTGGDARARGGGTCAGVFEGRSRGERSGPHRWVRRAGERLHVLAVGADEVEAAEEADRAARAHARVSLDELRRALGHHGLHRGRVLRGARSSRMQSA